MDATQLILAVSVFIITITVFAIGVWIIIVLNELRTTIQKANQILDDTHSITQAVSHPVESFSDFLMGFKNGLSIVNKFLNKEK